MVSTNFDHFTGQRVGLKVRESTFVGLVKDVYAWHHDDPCFVMELDGVGELSLHVIGGDFTIEAV